MLLEPIKFTKNEWIIYDYKLHLYLMTTNYIQHYFQNDFTLEVINNTLDWSDWIVLGLCVITIIISRLVNYNYLNQFYKKSPDYTSTNKISTFVLFLNFIFTSSFFLKQIFVTFSILKINSLSLYLILFVSILFIILLKFLILYVLRVLFNTKANYVVYYHLKFYQIIGLLLLPVFIFSYFLDNETKPYVYAISLIIYFLLIITREIQLFLIALRQRVSFLYIILYLCTLEILPLILVIKILIG